jgi:flagellar motility protein MotE (MotC chaperone)
MFKAVCRLGLEGIVSKKLDAPYRSGPSKTWIKVKIRKRPLRPALSMVRSNKVKVVVAILLIVAVPVCAQAQTPSVPRVSKDDAQKVVTIIKGDKAKSRTYCNIKKLGKQMERAYEERNIKLVDELSQKIESLEKTLGPEYVALVDRLGAIDPENDKLADEITSLFESLDKRCRR